MKGKLLPQKRKEIAVKGCWKCSLSRQYRHIAHYSEIQFQPDQLIKK